MISWFEKHNKTSWIVVFLIALAIFYVSSLTFSGGAGGTNFEAVLYHIGSFFFFSFFLQIALTKGSNKKLIFLAILISIAYGFSDEFHQIFVPGRASTFSDVFLDTVGVVYSFIFYFISIRYRELRKKSLYLKSRER